MAMHTCWHPRYELSSCGAAEKDDIGCHRRRCAAEFAEIGVQCPVCPGSLPAPVLLLLPAAVVALALFLAMARCSGLVGERALGAALEAPALTELLVL